MSIYEPFMTLAEFVLECDLCALNDEVTYINEDEAYFVYPSPGAILAVCAACGFEDAVGEIEYGPTQEEK